MRFFHLADLHIGKQLHGYSLKEDQEHILHEIAAYAKEERPDAIVIAGDVYDKASPSAEAVSIFDTFLTEIADLKPAIPVLMIAGNHDSAKRLDFAKAILDREQIYIAGTAPGTPEERIKKVTLSDEHGPVDFYLLPFLKPGYVRPVFGEKSDETADLTYEAAIEGLLKREDIDWNRRNVLVSHQFYTSPDKEPETCDSEVFSVGGLDRVPTTALQPFDYVALGHLHGPQTVGEDRIRYCGTPLKYSVSEAEQEKALHLITLGEKGSPVQVQKLPLHPLRDVRVLKGNLKDILREASPEMKEDYVSVTLTDEVEPYRPKDQLEEVYSHILEVRMDNTRTRKKLEGMAEDVQLGDPFITFQEFYQEVQGRELSEEETRVLQEILDQISNGEERELS